MLHCGVEVKEGATSLEMQAASRNLKRQSDRWSPLELPEET